MNARGGGSAEDLDVSSLSLTDAVEELKFAQEVGTYARTRD